MELDDIRGAFEVEMDGKIARKGGLADLGAEVDRVLAGLREGRQPVGSCHGQGAPRRASCLTLQPIVTV